MKLNDTLDIINQNQYKIDSFGKFEEDIQKKINYKFRLDWNYYSNAMEGNSLTRVETKQLMMDNVTIDGKPFKDIAEMRGHDAEVLEIFKVGKGELRISETRIRRMHKTIMHEDDPTKKECIGIWKTSNNYLINYKGERIDFLPHEEVPEAIHSLLNKTNASIDSILRKEKSAPHPTTVAFEFHFEYLKIHPFYDGNGRTGRLLMNLILISFGFPPVILREKDRDSYYKLLAEIQGYGADPKDFYVFLGEMLIESQQLVMDALEGKEIEEVDDFLKEIKLIKTKTENLELSKSPILIHTVYLSVEKEIWNELRKTLNHFDDLFTDNLVTRHVNYREEEFPTKDLTAMYNLHQVSTKPKNPSIFGHDIYKTDISSVKWTNIKYGLKGSKKESKFEIHLTINFEVNTYVVKLTVNNKLLHQVEKQYGDLLLLNIAEDFNKRLKEFLLTEIKSRL